jgi:ribosome maturation factor RimP
MKSVLQSSVFDLLAPLLTDEGMELVDVEYEETKRTKVLRLLIHRPGGVNAEDCRYVSEIVSPVLDVYGKIQGGYVLEVASPGIDRPLVTEADFRRNIGRKVRLEIRSATGRASRVEGALKKVSPGKISLSQSSGTMIEVLISEISKAQIQLLW